MFRRIVVALDGSSLSEAILPQVEQLVAQSPIEVVLLTVGPAPHGVEQHATGIVYADERVADEERELAAYLEPLAHALRAHRVTVNTRVRVGDPVAEIVRCAEEEGANAIAMSTHGRTGLDRLIHGSVAGAVLRATRLPVLLLRPTETAFARQHAADPGVMTII